MLVVASVVASATFGASAASAGVIDVTLAGPGTGTVTSSPAGIDCSNVPGSTQTACSHEFGFLTTAGTLTATPGEGSVLVSWSGVGFDVGTCTSGAVNPCMTGQLLSNQSVTATFAPAPDPPMATTGAASDVEFPAARVTGSVNPNSDDFPVSDCYFEYGLTTAYGDRAPCSPKTIAAGTSPVAVSASIGVLQANKTYHYRLVASNSGGTTRGADQTVTSAAAPADACPNAAIRTQQGPLAQRLPSCYAYEQVSPASTNGQRVMGYSFSPDALSVMTNSAGGYAGTENLPDLLSSYVATRGSGGWYSTPINPPARDFPLIGSLRGVIDYTSDLSRSLWYPTLAQDKGTDRFTPVIREADGTFTIAGPTNLGGISEYPVGTSGDLDTIVLQTRRRTGILTDGTTDTRSASVRSLVVVRRSESGEISVRQLGYRNSATMSPTCNLGLGGRSARGAISDDGEKVFFSPEGTGACATATGRRVWAKVGSADPIDLSATQCTDTCGTAAASFFWGASRDGNRVYFTTAQKLINDDQDTAARDDLYEYDFDDPDARLKPVTAGPLPNGAGVVAVTRISEDGSYVYFVANGRPLAGANPRGAVPQSGVNNLYVAHRTPGAARASIKFVGQLDVSDTQLTGASNRPAFTSTDGRFLLFSSRANLTNERTAGDAQLDPYRYDAVKHKLIRIWTNDPAHNGASRIGGPTFNGPQEADAFQKHWRSGWPISDDGRTIAFDTVERLGQGDVNDVVDTYMWREETGQLTMISDGKSVVASRFQAVSPSGGTVLFTSTASMVPTHRTAASALFAARREGGFLLPPPDDRVPCSGDACQGSSSVPPLLPAVGSVDFGGDGNVSPAPDQLRVSVGVSRLKVVTGWAARLKVRVPGAGRISVSGVALRRAGTSASKAGTYRLRIALGWRARQQLKKRGTLKVGARVSYRAKDGQSAGKTMAVTFKQPKRAATKKGGR